MTDHPWEAWLDAALSKRDAARQRRALAPLTATDGLRVTDATGRALTLFSSNDYLGLSSHPQVREAAASAAASQGMGPRGAALVCGYTDHHAALEHQLAALTHTEAALLFPTGFAANLATMATLGAPGVAIFSDALNHASIIDGISLARRAGATLHVYRHDDMAHLSALLDASDAERKVIVSDSVFSMDGDLAPLGELARLKRAHGALLVIDEAHGTLVFGPHGAGLAAQLHAQADVDLHVGTLSKAVGAQGGFVAASRAWCDLILNLGRAFVYSTALPVPVVAAARAALSVSASEEGDALRARLWRHIATFQAALSQPLFSPIAPVILGEEARALAASARLREAGLHVTAIRPPTVPANTSRLRITLSAGHTDDEVARLCEALRASR